MRRQQTDRTFNRRHLLMAIGAAAVTTTGLPRLVSSHGESSQRVPVPVMTVRRHAIMVMDDTIPPVIEAKQRAAFVAADYAIQAVKLSKSAAARDIALIAGDVDGLIAETRRQPHVKSMVAILVWTRHHQHLLELPLMSSADLLLVRASGPVFARRLMARGCQRAGGQYSWIEGLVDRMRQDGKPFLVRLQPSSQSRPIDPESIVLACLTAGLQLFGHQSKSHAAILNTGLGMHAAHQLNHSTTATGITTKGTQVHV